MERKGHLTPFYTFRVRQKNHLYILPYTSLTQHHSSWTPLYFSFAPPNCVSHFQVFFFHPHYYVFFLPYSPRHPFLPSTSLPPCLSLSPPWSSTYFLPHCSSLPPHPSPWGRLDPTPDLYPLLTPLKSLFMAVCLWMSVSVSLFLFVSFFLCFFFSFSLSLSLSLFLFLFLFLSLSLSFDKKCPSFERTALFCVRKK